MTDYKNKTRSPGEEFQEKIIKKFTEIIQKNKYSKIKDSHLFSFAITFFLELSNEYGYIVDKNGFMASYKNYENYLEYEYPGLVFHLNYLKNVSKMYYLNYFGDDLNEN